MSEDRPSTAAADTGGQRQSWLKRFGQILLRDPGDREQLVSLLRDAEQRGLLDADALAMTEGVLNVSDMQVRDIIVPRSQMVVINEDDTPEKLLPTVIQSAHSRFPVVGDSRDEIIGVLLAKDLLAYFGEHNALEAGDEAPKFNLRNMLRPAVFIPESKRLNVLLKDFRTNRNHMAIVVDEYGGVAGLVTIEDVLEQIVGDIEDEHDFDDDAFFVRHTDVRYTVKARAPIDEFNETFNADLRGDEFDTIGGLLMQEFGRLPERGEGCTLGRFHFTVLRADSRRIYLLRMRILPEETDDEAGSET